LPVALTIAKEIGDALDHAHDHGAVVHRDVSPSNVLLGYDGSIKLIDFGIAKVTDGATASGTLRGKITYMAPEQCKGESLDRRTDVYALGVMLYELVTGQRPFYADDDIASLHKIVAGAPPPHAATLGVDPTLADIVMRAMAHRASDRYESAAAFVAAIETYAATREIVLANALVGDELGEARPEPWRVATPSRSIAPPLPEPSPVRRSRRSVFAVIAAATVAAASLAIYVGLARPPAKAAPAPPAPAPTVSPVAAPAAIPPPLPVTNLEPAGTPDAPVSAPVQKRSRKQRASKPVADAAPKAPDVTEPPAAKPTAPRVWNSRSFDLPKKP
ncbi:MAG TPA: serine/threonine-protein kinase, partial [Kofleriaceae bacterium]